VTRDEVRVAQTNLQLYEELAERAYSPGEIAVVREAYALAMVLFASLYRATGKPFVAHAVGTASVLVAADAPIDLVAAALLHSAYTLGDFGSLLRRISPAKRARLRTAIGSSAEGLVARYAALTWGAPTVRAALAAPPSSDERAVLLIRLANEVDEFVDLGALHAPDAERRVAMAQTLLPLCIELAERLDAPSIARDLRSVRETTLASPRRPVVTLASAVSHLIAPPSYAPRLHVRLRMALGRARSFPGRLRVALGRSRANRS